MDDQLLARWRLELVALGIAGEDEFVGCTDVEIGEILQAWHVSRLPGLYDRFLRTCGRLCGNTWPGDDIRFPGVLNLVEVVDRLRQLDRRLVPEGAVAFFGHPGGDVRFFLDLDSDDPEVWVVNESVRQPPAPLHARFSDTLWYEIDAAREHIEAGFPPMTLAERRRDRKRQRFDARRQGPASEQ